MHDETVAHIFSEYPKLSQKVYKNTRKCDQSYPLKIM